MENDYSASLRELRESTNKLNALTDRANDLVRRTERFLSEECRVGGPIYVHVESLDEDVEPDGPCLETYLGYGRFKGEHRIIVEHVLEGDPRGAKPWAECSRDIKLASLDALPTLIKKLLEKVSKQVADVDAKLSALESMVTPNTGTKKPASRRRKG
jgi:hypothetical protein